jgi:FtsZ-binding cell division protein ZapB
LFFKEAFFLYEHKEQILADSRMFLTPLPFENNLAYTGTSGLRNATLGVYLEWWEECERAVIKKDGKVQALTYFIAGSPLSGSNHCAAVDRKGKRRTIQFESPFSELWSSFMRINQRYTEAKQLYQSYTLQQVLDILHQEDNGQTDFAPIIDILFMKHEIDVLNRQIASLQEQCDRWQSKYTALLGHYNEEKIRQLYAEYETLAANVDKEIDSLKEQKRNLKASLRKGSLDNISYQRQLTPLNKRIQDLMIRIGLFKINKVRETFPDNEDITFSMIETFVHNKRKEK